MFSVISLQLNFKCFLIPTFYIRNGGMCVENPYILCGPNNLELFMSDVLIFNGNVTVIQGL